VVNSTTDAVVLLLKLLDGHLPGIIGDVGGVVMTPLFVDRLSRSIAR
jgi:hypothetical protein